MTTIEGKRKDIWIGDLSSPEEDIRNCRASYKATRKLLKGKAHLATVRQDSLEPILYLTVRGRSADERELRESNIYKATVLPYGGVHFGEVDNTDHPVGEDETETRSVYCYVFDRLMPSESE